MNFNNVREVILQKLGLIAVIGLTFEKLQRFKKSEFFV